MFLDSGTCFGFWEVFLDSGTCFGFWDVFLDSGKCFGFWDVFLDSGTCFVRTSHRKIMSVSAVPNEVTRCEDNPKPNL